MIIGVFSDAHGNFLAFEQCLQLLNTLAVDKMFFLGDAVGYCPDGELVLSRLNSLAVECILGNHDAMLLGKLPLDSQRDTIYGVDRQRKKISQKNMDFLANWPQQRSFSINNSNILMVHGSPWDVSQGYVYPDSDMSIFVDLPYDVVFLGHTHRPFIRKVGNVKVVNVGSCGLPRDQGNLLSCALYDTDTGVVKIVRKYFDVEKVCNKYPEIHPDTYQCLHRIAKNEIIGEIVRA